MTQELSIGCDGSIDGQYTYVFDMGVQRVATVTLFKRSSVDPTERIVIDMNLMGQRNKVVQAAIRQLCEEGRI